MDPSEDPRRIGEGFLQGMIRGEIPLITGTTEDILLEEEISSYLNPSSDGLEENQGEDQMDEGQTNNNNNDGPSTGSGEIHIYKTSCYLYSLTDLDILIYIYIY